MLGARVALIERNMLGGDCLVTGCVPSKALIHASRIANTIRNAPNYGIKCGPINVDFPQVMKKLRQIRAEVASDDSASTVSSRGIDTIFGDARFTSPNTLEVDGTEISFKRAIICTGGRATIPPIPGLTEADPLTNESVFNLTELPPRLAIIGGGPIGCELGQAMARLGSKVTLFEVMDRILNIIDIEAGAIIEDQLKTDGVNILAKSQIVSVTPSENSWQINYTHDNSTQSVIVDKILVAAGRAPNIEHLNLEVANVAYNKKGVTIDSYQRTSNKRIYAAGDVSNAYKFTHSAYAYAEYATLNALLPIPLYNTKKLIMPFSVYEVDPENWTGGLVG